MPRRPSLPFVATELAVLAGAAALAAWQAPEADWDLFLLGALLGLSVASDLVRIELPVFRTSVSASFLAIVLAAALLGATPAVVVGLATIAATWARERYPADFLLINLVTFAWFPLLAGLAFHAATDATDTTGADGLFYVFVFGTFVLSLAINFSLIAGYSCYVERSSFASKIRRALVPLLPSELASAVLTLGIAYLYHELGTSSVALFGVVVVVFQWLVGALLVSERRAEELEQRTRQLAGFQVGLLSALVRTLDVRDRMTARHSAAVARYARDIAAEAELTEEQQELVHTAGLLHDIGKFVLPDSIMNAGRRPLTDEQWEAIRTHPEEGARIVSQIDGYAPIGELILAHHERLDGAGYPRGLSGDEIPVLARVLAVADTYDAITARDSYREPISSREAVFELRRVAGTQLDPRFVDAFARVLERSDLAYRHGDDADFDSELSLDTRIRDHATPSATRQPLPT